MAKPKSLVTEYQPVTIRIPLHIYETICDVASEEDRSMNEQVVRIMKLWYSEQVKRGQALNISCPPPTPGVAVAD